MTINPIHYRTPPIPPVPPNSPEDYQASISSEESFEDPEIFDLELEKQQQKSTPIPIPVKVTQIWNDQNFSD